MAIEIKARSKIKIPRWITVALLIFVILAILLFSSYIYFSFSINNLKEKIQETEKAIKKTPSEQALEKDILLKEKRINIFADLISQHRKPENIFSFLEKTTHPKVVFSEFSFDSSKNTVKLTGNAKSFISLGQQILLFQKEKNIKRINLSEVSIGELEGVDFSLELTFEPQFFLQ